MFAFGETWSIDVHAAVLQRMLSMHDALLLAPFATERSRRQARVFTWGVTNHVARLSLGKDAIGPLAKGIALKRCFNEEDSTRICKACRQVEGWTGTDIRIGTQGLAVCLIHAKTRDAFQRRQTNQGVGSPSALQLLLAGQILHSSAMLQLLLCMAGGWQMPWISQCQDKGCLSCRSGSLGTGQSAEHQNS